MHWQSTRAMITVPAKADTSRAAAYSRLEHSERNVPAKTRFKGTAKTAGHTMLVPHGGFLERRRWYGRSMYASFGNPTLICSHPNSFAGLG